MDKFIHNYSLSIILVMCFLVSWIGQGFFQWRHEISEAESHGQTLEVADYTDSFLASTLENWQSEFLQLFTFVILSTYFISRHSPQSKDGDEEMMKILRKLESKLSNK